MLWNAIKQSSQEGFVAPTSEPQQQSPTRPWRITEHVLRASQTGDFFGAREVEPMPWLLSLNQSCAHQQPSSTATRAFSPNLFTSNVSVIFYHTWELWQSQPTPALVSYSHPKTAARVARIVPMLAAAEIAVSHTLCLGGCLSFPRQLLLHQ